MINSFKYVFVKTKPSWFIGSSHDFLSFSSDGTTIAGTGKAEGKNNNNNGRRLFFSLEEEKDQVQFWETATGAATSSFKRSLFVVFSPTDPDIAVLVRSGSIHTLKRDSFKGKTWAGQHRLDGTTTSGAVCTFNSSGKTIVVSNGKNLHEYDTTTWSKSRDATSFVYGMTCIVCCPIKPNWFIIGDDRGELEVVSNNTYSLTRQPFRSRGRLTPVDRVGVSACAWSQDGKWIATGNDDGDIFLWDAGNPASVSFAMLLPRNQPNTSWARPTTSLVFVPDSTALIIISGGYLSVWDIENVEYVTNSGLPDKATNIALDGPRNRLAVVVNERITIYKLKMCQMDEKSSIPSELAEYDITKEVVKFDSEPLVGLYFDIYRGAWKFETPRIFQHVVAIKTLRPRKNAHERLEFEDRLLKFLTRWSELTHDNLIPLLGVSTAFHKFPAAITSWMTNGLLSEYIKTEEKYDKMKLITGVARGVAYLHSENIVHSDIRGSSILVDDFGQARLADPGLLYVLADGPSIVEGTVRAPYRCQWMAPELLKKYPAEASFATDVYSVTMTSLEIFTAGDPFRDRDDSDLIVRIAIINNLRPSRPEDVDDELWSLWGEGWNQNAALRPDMEEYVERLTQLV